MNCCPCFMFESSKVHDKEGETEPEDTTLQEAASTRPRHEKPPKFPTEAAFNIQNNKNIQAQTFTFRELAAATKNFRQETLLGEGGFGRVYKGQLAKTGQTVAVKQLDRNGMQGNKEFLVEVLMLSLLHHQNLVKLIGYCADGDQRLLVYEFMHLGSLEDHLLDLKAEDTPLNWFTRLKIALGAAQGLEYLHDKANPPVIYRDLKSSNILLDKEYNAKLADFGLAKLGPLGEKTHVSSRVMGTYGYCAPEYQRTGHLTLKSDIYSFGVVLLEIITGRRAIDPMRRIEEQNLVSWAEPYFRDPSKFPELADPLLEGNFPVKSLNQVVAIASMCLQEEASVRPLISDVVTALTFLGQGPDEIAPPPQPSPNLAEPGLDPGSAQLDTVMVPPMPVPAPTYDVGPQPVRAPTRQKTSPVQKQFMVPPLAQALAISQSSPALRPNMSAQNSTCDEEKEENNTKSDSSSEYDSDQSDSDAEDHQEEVRKETSTPHDQLPVSPLAPAKEAPTLALSQSSPTLFPHLSSPNSISDDNVRENNIESDSSSEDGFDWSESDAEDHQDEAMKEIKWLRRNHEQLSVQPLAPTPAQDLPQEKATNSTNDENQGENNTENDSNSDQRESDVEDNRDEDRKEISTPVQVQDPSEEAPVLFLHLPSQNSIYDNNQGEYNVESDSSSEDDIFGSDSEAEDQREEAVEEIRVQGQPQAASALASSQSSPALFPHTPAPNPMNFDGHEEYITEINNITEIENSTEDDSDQSESDAEDHPDEARKENSTLHEQLPVPPLVSSQLSFAQFQHQRENITKSDSSSDDDTDESESDEEDNGDEAKENDEFDEESAYTIEWGPNSGSGRQRFLCEENA